MQKVFPWVFLHWEDFGRENARHNLDTYRQKICSFNDDIQGTVITVAALLAVRASRQHQGAKIVFGAGSAGTGITDRICDAMVHSGMSPEEAKKQFG